MERIRSFAVDHDGLPCGIYLSRVDGDVLTYDLRMRTPNGGDYISPLAAHSLEHLLATFMRAGADGERVFYVGPMGCRTGFYVLMRRTDVAGADLAAIKTAFAAIAVYDGKMPGAHRKECGNYRCLSVSAAKKEAVRYLAVLEALPPDHDFAYPKKPEGGI